MNKTVKQYLSLTAICLLAMWAFSQKKIIQQNIGTPMKNNAPLENTIVVDTPKQYIFRITIDAGALGRIDYVLDSLMGQWGIEKGGTEIRSAGIIYSNHWNYLKKLAVLDSITINTPHKPGK